MEIAPVIIRAALWPIESIDKLRSPNLIEKIDRWFDSERDIQLSAEHTSKEIYALIPSIADKPLRNALLLIRRFIYRTVEPIPFSLLEPIITSSSISLFLKDSLSYQFDARLSLAYARIELEAEYESCLDAEYEELCRITNDTKFIKTLYLSSPAIYNALGKSKIENNNKHPTKLDLAVYSYVMRSVGRATPNGVWAGVAMENPQYKMHTASDMNAGLMHIEWSSPGKTVFTPILSFFIKAFRIMVNRYPYKEEILFRLNPTLFKRDAFTWQYEHYIEERYETFHAANHRIFSNLTSLFSDTSARSLQEIRDHLLAYKVVLSEKEAKDIVDYLHRVGIIWSPVDFQATCSDPWSMMEDVIAKVPLSERSHWNFCLQNLKEICVFLEDHYWNLSLQELQRHMSCARDYVNTLLKRYDIDPVPDDMHVLIVDIGAPLHFTISSKMRVSIEKAVKSYWNFDRFGLGKIEALSECKQKFGSLYSINDQPLTEYIRQQQFKVTNATADLTSDSHISQEAHKNGQNSCVASSPLPFTSWETIMFSMDDEQKSSAKKAFAIWYEQLHKVFANQHHNLSVDQAQSNYTHGHLSPGSALLRLAISENNCIIRIGSVTFDPCFFYSRFGFLFSKSGSKKEDPFLVWYQQSLTNLEFLFPTLKFGDLLIRTEHNANAASRSRMTQLVLDPFDSHGGILTEAIIRIANDGRPRVRITTRNITIIPYLHSAITSRFDIYSECLYNISRLVGRPSLIQPLPLFSIEIEKWHHLPRLCIDKTIVVSPERWTTPSSFITELANTSRFERFLRWRKFVSDNNLPRLIYGKYGLHQTEMLMSADSILAVEHLGNQLKIHGGTLTIQEVFPSPYDSWLCDNTGHHYLGEFAVAWQGEPSFWSNYLQDSEKVESQPS